jgi:type I restriction enzyme R subunit
MIGRGTRVLEEDLSKRKAWCPEKDKFLIIDSWGNFEYFKMKPKGREPGHQVPLPVKLFKARLDNLEAALAVDRQDVVDAVKADLRKDLAALPQNNILIKESSADLARTDTDQFWNDLDEVDLGFLRSTIAPILRARTNIEIKSLRFETEVVEMNTAILSDNEATFEATKESIIAQVMELPLSINVIKKHETLVDNIKHEHWWTTPTQDKLQELVVKIAPLMRFRQSKPGGMLKLDIADLVVIKEMIEFGPEHERMSTSAYRQRIESYIWGLVESNPVLKKIQAGQAIDDSDIIDLAHLLKDQGPYVTEELLRKVYDHKTARFIQFIKHILKVEILQSWTETVAKAFEGFIAEHNTFSTLQISFLQTLKTFILQTGAVEKKSLIQAPFTRLHPKGIRGIFDNNYIDEILTFAGQLVSYQQAKEHNDANIRPSN